MGVSVAMETRVLIQSAQKLMQPEKKVKDNIIWSSIGTNDCMKKKIRSKIRLYVHTIGNGASYQCMKRKLTCKDR